MRKRARFLIYSLFSLIILVITGGSPLAAESSNAPVSGIENLLRGTQYEQLLIENRGKPSTVADKGGFVPNFGNYFDETNVGWGLDIQSAGDLIFAVWFTYLADGSPYWYIIVGELEAKGGGMSMTGDINSFKWDGMDAAPTNRGTLTITWSDESNADVSWTLDGVSGFAGMLFALFAPAIVAVANPTGHYFDFNAPGWGFTLLTQDSTTVVTMYWYSENQPVWAQGVTFKPGFNQFFELLFFNGPGLCPSCLAKGHGTFTATPLAEVRVNWLADDPPIAGILWTENPFKGGPLGARPFSDIPLDTQQVTTQAFTSAFMDHWDPTYQWLVEKAKGVGCFPFQYDPGLVQPFPPVVTGNLQTAYIGLDPVDGVLPVYTDANCVIPFVFDVFGELVPSFLRMGSTGDDGGFAMDWFSEFDFGAGGEKGSVEKNHRHAPGYDEFCEACDDEDDDDDDDRATKGEGTIYVYGVTPTLTFEFDGMVAIVPSSGSEIDPPTVEEILKDPEDGATMSMTIP